MTRNRSAVAIAALLAISLIGGVTATLWQARRAEAERARAERRFDDVRQLANSFLFEHDKAIANLPGSTPARELLVRRALRYLDGLSREASDDRSLRRELAEAYQKVGDVQNNPFRASLGDSAGALASYGKARTILAALAAEDPADVRVRRDLAHCYTAIGDLEWTAGDGTAAAVRNYREALALREAISAADPTNVDARLELARSHHSLGTMSTEMTDKLKAVELSEALFAEEPTNRRIRVMLATSQQSLGSELASRGDTARALELQGKALLVHRALLTEDPSNTTSMRQVAASCFQVGSVLETTGDTAGALEKYREMLAIYQKLTAADPTDAQARAATATPHNMIGRVLVKRADIPGALTSYREALAIGEPALATDPKNAQIRYSLAISRRGLGDVYAMLASQRQVPAAMRVQHWHEARGWFQQSRDDLSDMKARGLLNHPESMKELDEIAGRIARCDRALAEGK